MTVLVTGFEPFGSHHNNPSAILARTLDGERIGGEEITGLVLPVDRYAAPRLLEEAVTGLRPTIVLPLGLAGSRASLAMERVAINVLDFPLPDNGGYHPVDLPAVEGGPDAYFSTLPVKRVVEAWRASGIPGYVSNTAGTYLCNQIMYVALHLGHTAGFRSGFIHVPCLPEDVTGRPSTPSMAFEFMIAGIRLALSVSVTANTDVTTAAGALY